MENAVNCNVNQINIKKLGCLLTFFFIIATSNSVTALKRGSCVTIILASRKETEISDKENRSVPGVPALLWVMLLLASNKLELL